MVPPAGGGSTLTLTPTANPTAIVGNGITSPAVFTGVSIGTGSSDRIVVVALASLEAVDPGGLPSAVTITPSGGSAISATQAVHSASSSRVMDIWYALVPTATTADIRVAITNGTGWSDGVEIAVYSMVGSATASVASTVTSVAYPTAANQSPNSATVTIPAGGGAIIKGIMDGTGSTTWAGATKDYEQQYSADGSAQVGTTASATASGTVSENVTYSGGSLSGWVAAVFQP